MAHDRLAQIGIAATGCLACFACAEIDRCQSEWRRCGQGAVGVQKRFYFGQMLAIADGRHQHDQLCPSELGRRGQVRQQIPRCRKRPPIIQSPPNMFSNSPRLSVARRVIDCNHVATRCRNSRHQIAQMTDARQSVPHVRHWVQKRMRSPPRNGVVAYNLWPFFWNFLPADLSLPPPPGFT